MARARDEALSLLDLRPGDLEMQYVASGILIDAGASLQELSTVDTGIDLVEKLLCRTDDSSGLIALKYNLSNGYAARAAILRNAEKDKEADDALQKQKLLLQAILLREADTPAYLLPRVLTNYANLMDYLGRSFEAVDYFIKALLLAPEHPVAMANCSHTIWRLIAFSGSHQRSNAREAWRLLNNACEFKEEIVKIAGPDALRAYRQRLVELEAEIDAHFKGGVHGHTSNSRCGVHGANEEDWRGMLAADRLILTFCHFPEHACAHVGDDAFFERLIDNIPINWRRFRKLAHGLNGIKEDFAAARYIYYHRLDEAAQLAQRGALTMYADTLDYSEFGLGSGLLKASFRLAVDCFDKIAVFLADYLGLQQGKRFVNFNNVWFAGASPKKRKLNHELARLMKDNEFLRALRDMQQDWWRQEFPGRLKDTRNAATHRTLVLSWLASDLDVDEHGLAWSAEDLEKATLLLLRSLKAAILYVIAFVNFKEARRARDTAGILAPLPFSLGVGMADQMSC